MINKKEQFQFSYRKSVLKKFKCKRNVNCIMDTTILAVRKQQNIIMRSIIVA